jgi:hypothetical protein
VKSETSMTLPLVEVDAMDESVKWLNVEASIGADLPDVVKFRLLMDEAEPTCAE